jgi:lysophospholipase L1-like esterase
VQRSIAAAWAAALTACAVMASACTSNVTATPSAESSSPEATPVPPGLNYVALGDSYTAGPLIPTLTGTPTGCFRSTANYPALVAEVIRPASVKDVSCGGAATADLTRSQAVSVGGGANIPQLQALAPTTDLVTLGIGGNDIGFIEIVNTCARLSKTEPAGAACRDHYLAGGADQLAARITATAPKVAAALRAVRATAPTARVLLVGYPVLAPDSGPGCFPDVPFTAGDVAYLRTVEQRLNAMLAEQARATGATYVDTYTPSVGHDWCQPTGTKWVEALNPTSPAAPAHPNALGMQATARAVLAVLGR